MARSPASLWCPTTRARLVQVSRRAGFGRARFLWGKLTDAQRAAWNRTAGGKRTRRRLNQSGPLSGYLLFVKINCNLAAVGLEMVLDPPEVPDFEPSPVRALSITNSNGEVALGLSLSARPAGRIVVSGSKPRSPGRTSEDHFAILGLLEDPVRGVNDFTALYVAKYGLPPAGSRVFIQTAQQIDGWQDVPRVTSAVVPVS